MSTALSVTVHPETNLDVPSPGTPTRHLRPVPDAELSIESVPRFSATDVRQAGRIDQVALDPREEFAPTQNPDIRVGHSNVFSFRGTQHQRPMEHWHIMQLADIKKMTRTVGSAFIEAELGIRPFAQLSTWIELELFHKLRARVIHIANGKHSAARRGKAAARKVPSITPIGVRASMQINGDWESSMTIRVGERARAIAMRLQLHRDRWRVIALEVG